MRFSLGTIQPLKLGRVSAVTTPGKRAPRSAAAGCVVSVGGSVVAMRLSFLPSDLFDLCIAARVDQIGSQDRDRHLDSVGSLAVPAYFPERFLVDLFLQFDHACDQGLRGGRAAGYIHIDRQELVD